ncbi:MAG: tetratricopeptide repeat protein [Nitrosomonadales bacterium]|nr:tetratricopeptide repeat protein [Nitrosomonadales bacterium]
MSLINQMLNELERRGAGGLPDEQAVRAVPVARQRRVGLVLVGGLALLVLAVAGWRYYAAPVHEATPEIVPPPTAVPLPSPPVSVAHSAVAARVEKAASAKTPPAKVAQPAPKQEVAAKQKSAVKSVAQAVPVKPVTPPPKPEVPPAPQSIAEAPVKQITPQQQADHEYRQAVLAMQQGHVAEALAGYESALRLDAGQEGARRALVGWLLENKRHDDAERLLQEGVKLNPKHTGFAMLLARLQVEHNDLPQALATLHAALPYAKQQADYQAFMAALLQRGDRHAEAIPYYQAALQLAPDTALWLMGLGISLQATQRSADAREVFRRAAALHGLAPELQAFVEQRLKELSP